MEGELKLIHFSSMLTYTFQVLKIMLKFEKKIKDGKLWFHCPMESSDKYHL